MRPRPDSLGPLVCALALSLAAGTAARAHQSVFIAKLDGVSGEIPSGSPGSGFVIATVDLDLVTLRLEVEFVGLEGGATFARVHAPTDHPLQGAAAPATMLPGLADFPSGASGTYDRTFSLGVAETYNPAFIASHGGAISPALSAFVEALEEGKAYFSISTSAYSAGEISGFLLATPQADFTRDGVVDADDLSAWTAAFGQAPGGDANSDGWTDGDDLLIWQHLFGSMAGVGAGHHHASAVPEPSASTFTIGLITSLVACRRRGWRNAKAVFRLFSNK